MSRVKPILGGGDRIAPLKVADRILAESNSPDSHCDFRALCDRSLAGMYVIQDECFKYANPALAELLGCRPQDLDGASPLSFVLPDDRTEVAAHMRRRSNGDAESSRFETRCLRADGTVAHVEILGSRLLYDGQPALMGTIVDITARKQVESATKDRLRFEQLLADLSAQFVNLRADQIDGQIDSSLKLLVEFLGNDRSTLVEFGDDPEHVLMTHSYAVDEWEAFPVGSLPVARLPWFIGQFRSGQTVFLKDVLDELPAEAKEEREYCQAHRVQSNVTVPLIVGGTVLGGLTFAFKSQRCDWPDEIISRLQTIGEVFANALVRRRTEESLHAPLDENRRLRQQLEQENQYLREQVVLKHQHGRFVGRSDAITRVLAAAERVAVNDAPPGTDHRKAMVWNGGSLRAHHRARTEAIGDSGRPPQFERADGSFQGMPRMPDHAGR